AGGGLQLLGDQLDVLEACAAVGVEDVDSLAVALERAVVGGDDIGDDGVVFEFLEGEHSSGRTDAGGVGGGEAALRASAVYADGVERVAAGVTPGDDVVGGGAGARVDVAGAGAAAVGAADGVLRRGPVVVDGVEAVPEVGLGGGAEEDEGAAAAAAAAGFLEIAAFEEQAQADVADFLWRIGIGRLRGDGDEIVVTDRDAGV